MRPFSPARPLRGCRAAVVAAVLVPACSGDGGGDTTPDPTPTIGVGVAPAAIAVTAGGSGTTAVTVTRGGGYVGGVSLAATAAAGLTATLAPATVLPGATSGALAVDVASTVAAGTYPVTLTATGTGVASRSATLTVTVTSPPALSVSVAPTTLTLPLGLASQLTATVRDAAGAIVTGRAIAWSSSDTATARVDANGLLVTGRTGTATIGASTGTFRGEASVTVAAPPPIAACRLPNRTSAVGFGFPRAAHRLRTTGTVRATVLFVDFSDAPATRTPQSVLDIVQPTAPAFYSAVSYGAMRFELEPDLRWLRMSRPSTQYGWTSLTFASHRAFLQEAADLAAATTDFARTDLLVVMTNPDAGAIANGPALVANAGDGIRVPGRATTIDNATNSGRDLLAWRGTWLNHEVGHLMSLPDLYSYDAPANAIHLHVGEWSQMGLISGRAPEYTAFERWQLGWLGDAQMVCAPSGTSLASLTPVESAGGLKAVLVPLTETRAVVVESRRARGLDARLTQPGPLVYLIDTGVSSGRGTMRVLPIDDADRVKLTRTLAVGQTIAFEGVNVTLVSRTDDADVVRVTRP